MNNKEAYKKLFGYPHSYDESNNGIYYYPCDDLHGTFSSGNCNCSTQIKREYISQSVIDKRIADYEQAQQSNANLYEVSVTLRGNINVNPCNSTDERKRNVVYHVGSDTNFTMYCEADDIESTKKMLKGLCVQKLDGKIEEAENAKRIFLERTV